MVLEDATAMAAATTTQLNALAAYMTTMPSGQLASFRASHRITTGQAVGGLTPIVFNTILTDTASGWNSGTGIYTIPSPGLYLCSLALVWGNATASRALIHGIPSTWYPFANIVGCGITTSGRSSKVGLTPVRFAGGEAVSAQVADALTLRAVIITGQDDHVFEIIQVGS